MRVPGLTKNRLGVFVYRRVVPPDLRERIGSSEVKRTLGTKNHADALRRLPAVRDEVDALLGSAASEVVLSPLQAEALANQWLAEELRKDEQERRAAGFPIDHDQSAAWEASAEAHAESAERRRIAGVASEVVALLQRNGLAIPPKSPSWRMVAEALLLARVRLHSELARRASGKWQPDAQVFSGATDDVLVEARTKIVPKVIRSAPGTPVLSALIEKWAQERKPPARTLHEWRKAGERFKELHGDLRVDTITKLHVVALKDALIEHGKAPATVEKNIGALRSVLRFAVDNGMRPDNPAAGIRIIDANAGKERRLPFTTDQLRVLFGSDIYRKGHRPAAGAGEASFWLPLLGLFTGARLGELAQLTKADLTKAASGVWCLSIDDRAEGKRVKNAAARRKVPVHPALIDAGFLRYVETITGSGRLFPALKGDKFGAPAGLFSKWFGRWLTKLGLTDRRLTFHSLRHTMIDGCREAGIAKDVYSRITGHTLADVGDAYGVGYTVKRLHEELSKVKWKGLTVPRWSPHGSAAASSSGPKR